MNHTVFQKTPDKSFFFIRLLSLVIILIVLAIPLSPLNAQNQDTIYSIDTRAEIDAEGNLHIEQIWDCFNAKGTEWFIPMPNLREDTNIQDLHVRANSKDFTFTDNWDVDASFDEKAYRCGINHNTSNGSEICFGKSSLGEMRYQLSYTVTNGVSKTKDNIPFLYFRFLNDKMDPAAKKASFAIHYEQLAPAVTAEIWGFGFDSHMKAVNQAYETEPFDFSKKHHITILMRFDTANSEEKNTLLANLTQDTRSFDEIQSIALAGSTYEKSKDSTLLRRINNFIFERGPVHFIIVLLVFILILFVFVKLIQWIVKNLDFKDRKKPLNWRESRVPADFQSRDIPYDGQIDLIHFFADMKSGLTPKYQLGFMGAYLLKWAKEGAIAVSERKPFMKKKKDKVLQFNHTPTLSSDLESLSWEILQKASRKNYLSEHQLIRYARSHYRSLERKVQKALDSTKDTAMAMGLIVPNAEHKKYFDLTNSGLELLKNIVGLKRFIKDFSSSDERSQENLSNSYQYLMMASIFGLSDDLEKKIAQDFSVHHFTEEGSTTQPNDFVELARIIYFAGRIQNAFNSGIRYGKNNLNTSGQHSSFSGGGGGFYGGGSGGGSR